MKAGEPKILYLDIETAPSLGYFFDLFREGNIVRTVKTWFILSYAYKWEHERGYHCRALCDYKGYKKDKQNDRALLEDLWKLLDEADWVVAHNGTRFDLRKIRSRLLFHRIKPYSPVKVIDTLKVMRSVFAEDSNKLDAIARTHKLGAKLPHTGFKLWEDCINGLRPAWRMMKKYNIHDVRLLVATYKLIRPWMPNHPAYAKTGCPTCGSHDTQRRGTDRNRKREYQRLHCRGCGAWFSGDLIKNDQGREKQAA